MQCPMRPLACGLHHGNGDIHRGRYDSLTHVLGFEKATVTQDPVDLHLLLFKVDIQSDLQCTERRKQMNTHIV